MGDVGTETLGDLPDRLAIERPDLFAIEEEFHRFGLAVARSHLVAFRRHQLPSGFDNSSGKYFITHNRGFGTAWPRPQIEASVTSHGPLAISLAAFSVPARHGVTDRNFHPQTTSSDATESP